MYEREINDSIALFGVSKLREGMLVCGLWCLEKTVEQPHSLRWSVHPVYKL